jgi:hypothetical protein
VLAHITTFPAVAPPQSILWDLADDDGNHLDLSVPAATCCQQVQLAATADTAASQGIDWATWQAFLATPKTLHSAMTWNGQTDYSDISVPDHFNLGKLQIWTFEWMWPPFFGSDPKTHIDGYISEFVTVPEPASWLLAMLGLAMIAFRSRISASQDAPGIAPRGRADLG